jgi:hypothetical protein
MGAIMKHQIIAATILGVAILVSVGVSIYFSPYQSCVRSSLAYDEIVAWHDLQTTTNPADRAALQSMRDRQLEWASAHVTCAAR